MGFFHRLFKPVAKNSIDKPKGYRLVSVNNKYRYTVPENKVYIGRGSEMRDLFEKNLLVARRQAALSIREGKLFIRNYGTNPSFINGRAINIQDEWFELHDGDELVIVNVPLRVSAFPVRR